MFAKSSADRLKPKALVLEPKLQVWVASAGACGEPKCGRATKSGGFCNVSAPCKRHKSQADEENSMTAEDKLSCKIERGTCDVTLRDGEDICDNIKGRCDWHAPDSQRCQSMIERDPERRCWNYRQEASDYCRDYHEFPNVSVNAKAYGEDCCRHPKKVCERAEFLMKYYPIADPDRFSISTGDFLGYIRRQSGRDDLCQVVYNIPRHSPPIAEVEKIIEMPLLLHGNVTACAGHVNHTLSDHGSQCRALATDTGFKIQMGDTEVARITI